MDAPSDATFPQFSLNERLAIFVLCSLASPLDNELGAEQFYNRRRRPPIASASERYRVSDALLHSGTLQI